VKAASDIFAPVSGKITEVNTKLSDQAGLLNTSPENEGTSIILLKYHRKDFVFIH
jgi:glycine cleavage system H lipoate-binding protein